ncbi:MAG: DUF4390 domain-containing protein [Gammaproteobacteria bacterium]|nr:DUF4390 domain-containing protein [Gammaproteobacteria bacterium]
MRRPDVLFSCRALFAVTALSLILPAAVWAGSIRILDAELSPQQDGFLLRADSDIELNATIERGLQSGVPLYFNVDVDLFQQRRFWWDRHILEVRRRYSLVYYELTRHYRISALGLDQTRNFRSLLDALDYLGTIRDLPIGSTQEHLLDGRLPLQPQLHYRAALNIALDVGALPLALRPQALVSSAWRLRSEEYHWRVD